MIAPMYAPPEAYRETIERVRALPGAHARDRATSRSSATRRSRRSSTPAARRATGSPQLVAAALDETPRTLLELCARVHAAYGGLPDERVADLALTVDGHLAELVAAGRADVASGDPRRFRSRA